MPGIINQQSLYQVIYQLQQQVQGLATQQTGGVCQPNGLQRVSWGLLASGDYGFSVTDPNSVSNEIWPVSTEYYGSTTLTTSSTTPVSLANSPSVTCWIGASGDALLTVSAYIGVSGTSTGVVYLKVDSGTANSYVDLSNSNTQGIAGNVTAQRRLSQFVGTLTPNQDHTFSLEYASLSGSLANFGAISITVQPL